MAERHGQSLTARDGRQSLRAHAAAKGREIHLRYGPRIGWGELRRLLEDRQCARYPCAIAFDAAPLLPGELAWPRPKGNRPEDGFVMHVHPLFEAELDQVPLLVLYQLAAVNYGVFAGPADAEAFGAAALGLDPRDYYAALCRLADRLGAG